MSKPRAKAVRAWKAAIERCGDSQNKSFHRYGGRGICVHPAWLASFDAFYAAVGPPPTPKHQLDRYPNNDGNYEPGNVRWATPKENCANKSNNRHITHNGRTQIVKAWAEEIGVSSVTIIRRLNDDWPTEKVLTPARRCDRHGQQGSKAYRSWAYMVHTKRTKIPERWLAFVNFVADVGPAPTDAHHLEILDRKKPIETGNVGWMTHAESRNWRNANRNEQQHGHRETMTAMAKRAGLPRFVVYERMYRGQTLEEALAQPYTGKRT